MNYCSFACIALFFAHMLSANQPAMVIVPVADLVGAPIQTFHLAKTIKESYAKINICGASPLPTQGSPRIHQLLLHELVEIVSEEGDEVCIIIPQLFFITHAFHKPQAMYWTLKNNLISLKKLEARQLSDKIAPSPSYKKPQAIADAQNTVVLIKPFHDTVTQQTLSAGTRFIVDSQQSDQDYYFVFVFDQATTTFRSIKIPKKILVRIQTHSKASSIASFVQLLKQWAHCINGPIAYVWGGCSFTHCCNHEFVERTKKLTNGKKISVFERSECTHNPLTGFDCAGIISRAAQICGIPYYFKNTYTLAHYLKSLAIDQHLQEGDLIWIPGHVMIVSDIPHNKIIEARGYASNYGIVHEIPLEHIFKGIKTYDDLIKAYHRQTPLIRKNKEGQEVEEVTRYKVLKLDSAWNYSTY